MKVAGAAKVVVVTAAAVTEKERVAEAVREVAHQEAGSVVEVTAVEAPRVEGEKVEVTTAVEKAAADLQAATVEVALVGPP